MSLEVSQNSQENTKLTFCLKMCLEKLSLYCYIRMTVFCVSNYMKSVQMRSFFWSIFSPFFHGVSLYSVRMRENTDQKKIRIWTLFMRWHFIGNAVTKHQRTYRYALVLQTPYIDPKYLAIKYFNAYFDGNELLFPFLYFTEQPPVSIKTKAFIRRNVWFTPSNRIYLLQNYFSNYVYLKDMYITLTGISKLHGHLH